MSSSSEFSARTGVLLTGSSQEGGDGAGLATGAIDSVPQEAEITPQPTRRQHENTAYSVITKEGFPPFRVDKNDALPKLDRPLGRTDGRGKTFYIIGPDVILSQAGERLLLIKDEIRAFRGLVQSGGELSLPTHVQGFTEAAIRMAHAGLAQIMIAEGMTSLSLDLDRVGINDLRNFNRAKGSVPEVPMLSADRPPKLEMAFCQEQLRSQGFALTTAKALGLSANHPEYIRTHYFDPPEALRDDPLNEPVGRRRARDLVDCERMSRDILVDEEGNIVFEVPSSVLRLRPHINTEIGAREKGRAEDLRFDACSDKEWRAFIRRAMDLVPPEEREWVTTFGMNLFRTVKDVTVNPHQDKENFVILYCLGVFQGHGARTYLYPTVAPGKFSIYPAFAGTLAEGDILMFRDEDFYHLSSEIYPSRYAEGRQHRDMVVCTVNHNETHRWQENRASWGFPGI